MTGATSARAHSRAMARTASCSRVSSKSMPRSHRGADVVPDEAHDLLGRRARSEELLHAQGLEGPDVLRGNDAPAEHRDVLRALLFEQLEHALDQVVGGAREPAEPDRVGVLLHGGAHDLPRGVVQPRVDGLEARVPEGARHDLGASIVPVEPRLGHHHSDLPLRHVAPRYAKIVRMRSATLMMSSRLPGTTFQSKPFPSPVQRGIRCIWKWPTDWKAAAPLAWRRLSPSELSAFRRAPATFFTVAMTALRSSTSAS